jgi:hypothetical protein
VLSIQNMQKETHFYENEHNERHKYIETLNQDSDKKRCEELYPKNTYGDE